jgi:hypothetical protein
VEPISQGGLEYFAVERFLGGKVIEETGAADADLFGDIVE